MTGNPQNVVYPYTADASVTLPSEISTPKGGLAPEGIRLAGTVSNNAVTLAYESAFLKLTFKNVPVFADRIFFDGNAGDVTVSGISLSERGDVVAYLPVDPLNTGFTVSLQDDNGNTILSRSTSGKTFTAGTLKKMQELTVDGIILAFTDQRTGDEAIKYLKLIKRVDDNDWGDNIWTELLSTGSGLKYYILPTSGYDWIGNYYQVRIELYKSDTSAGAQVVTPNFLLRDMNFTITAESYLTAKYRYYVYMSNSQLTYWNNSGGNDAVKFSAWNDSEQFYLNSDSLPRYAFSDGYIYYYEADASVSGRYLGYRFYHPYNDNWQSIKDSDFPQLIQDIHAANL